jgi:anti-anti-sigma factor
MPEIPIFSLSVQRADGHARVVVEGELDMETAPQLVRTIEALLKDEAVEVVVDLRTLTFMDSSGLQALLHGYNEAQRINKPFALIRGTETVMRVFELSGVDGHIPFARPFSVD